MKLITTSWDDGNPKDFRIAELLQKYNLQGTFYIPKANPEHAVMSENEVYSLSEKFEIGGHTLNHVRLKGNQPETVEYEVKGCFTWLKNILAAEPVSFCFPGGVYDNRVIRSVSNSGFKIFRTTELLSISNINESLIPTSMQLYEHTRFTYLKHLVKRKRIDNLIQWLQSNSTTDLLKLTDYYIAKIQNNGQGCFHLWGHSWEIEEFGLWQKMDAVLKHLSAHTDFRAVQNKDLLTIANIN